MGLDYGRFEKDEAAGKKKIKTRKVHCFVVQSQKFYKVETDMLTFSHINASHHTFQITRQSVMCVSSCVGPVRPMPFSPL